MGPGRGDDRCDCPAPQPEREPPAVYDDYETITVPDDHETIQAAVDAAEPRTLVLVKPGIYTEAVQVDTPRVTIRGLDRNTVILDGEFERTIGIVGLEDEIVVENMTARNYMEHGFFWTGMEGYRGSYLTAYNNRMYGIYASGSVHGRFDNCYASGSDDAGFYIGHAAPCHAIMTDCVAEYNGLGFSGTNSGGWFTIKDSVFRYNKAGILPNTMASVEEPPQHKMRIENNEVYANNNTESPSRDYAFMAFGTGIMVAGGDENEILNNEVYDHVNFGITISLMRHRGWWLPRGNEVRNNEVRESKRADLALTMPNGGGNEFVGNDHSSSRPWGLSSGVPGAGLGDPWVTTVYLNQMAQVETDNYPEGDWRNSPHPDRKQCMPDVDAPPGEAVSR